VTSGGVFVFRALAQLRHADRSEPRPKTSKLANNQALRDEVQDRRAALISPPDGTALDLPLMGRNTVGR